MSKLHPSRPSARRTTATAQGSRPKPLRILVASGVNLDLLGSREPDHYGTATLADMERLLRAEAAAKAVDLTFFQSNDEAKFLEVLAQGWDGAILNPGAWTHTSLALADRLAATKLRFVEVHLSKVMAREAIRQTSLIAAHALGSISGFGIDSYRLGLLALLAPS